MLLLVKEQNMSKVDFIKMDIEGAEPYALDGALQTIKQWAMLNTKKDREQSKMTVVPPKLNQLLLEHIQSMRDDLNEINKWVL